ncbi:MAG: hypothetical protein ABIJ41_07980 [Candidatus Omnitrophota bacterium]
MQDYSTYIAFFVSRILFALLIAFGIGWILTATRKSLKSDSTKMRWWNVIAVSSPLYLLVLFLMGQIPTIFQKPSGDLLSNMPYLMFVAHIGMMLFSLPLLAFAHVMGGFIVERKKPFFLLAAVYLCVFLISFSFVYRGFKASKEAATQLE